MGVSDTRGIILADEFHAYKEDNWADIKVNIKALQNILINQCHLE